MNLLQEGIAAARAGRKAEARALLMQVVEADERSEQGWLWLSGVVEEPEDMRTCLQNVLDINPQNAAARKGMSWIEARYGPAETPAASLAEPEPPLEKAVGEAFTRTTAQLRPVPPRAEPAPPATVFDPLAPDNRPAGRATPPATVFDPLAPDNRPAGQATPPPAQRASLAAAPSLPATPSAAPAGRAAAPPAQPNPRINIPEAPASPPPIRPTAASARQPVEPPAPAAKKRPDPPITTMYAPVVPLMPTESIELLCPYCGSPTTLKQQRCTQCRQSLMVRAAPAPQRSLALTLLSIVWGLGGALVLFTAGLFAVLLLLRQAPTNRAQVSVNDLAISIAVLVVFGGICLYLTRGLWARSREFYYLNMVLIVVAIGARAGLLLQGAGFVNGLGQAANLSSAWSGPLTLILGALQPALGVLLVLLPFVLTVLSFRDFFGPHTRFTPTLKKTDHLQHYNNGIGYRDRGMWYMAIQEWAAANRLKPTERTYLQTLGLAYAQIRKLHPNSTASLGNIEAFLRSRKADLYAAAPELERLNLL